MIKDMSKGVRIVKAGSENLFNVIHLMDETDTRLIHKCLVLEYQKRFKHLTNRQVTYWTRLLDIFDVDKD